MKKLILVTLVLLVVGTMFACPEGKMNHGNRNMKKSGRMMGRDHGKMQNHHGMGNSRIKFLLHCEELELSEKQEERITTIANTVKKEEIDIHAEIKKLSIDKREAMKNSNFTKAKSLTREISKLKTDGHIKMIETKEKITKILTKKQINTLKKLRDEKHGFRKEHRMKK